MGDTRVERRVISAAKRDAAHFNSLGVRLSTKRRYAEAERAFHAAIDTEPDLPMPHNNLGWVQEKLGQERDALHSYERALELNPELVRAQVNLSKLLFKLGQTEGFQSWNVVREATNRDRKTLEDLLARAKDSGDLQMASVYADAYAYRCGGTLPDAQFLTIPKLIHEIDQFLYLRDSGVIVEDLSRIIDAYREVLDRALCERQSGERWNLTAFEQAKIGKYYNRIIHRRDTRRVPKALSETWDRKVVETDYLENTTGVAVIDDFLTETALESLRLFCLESVIWFNNRYAYGRLGAFFNRGFNCPLIIQLAEEIATRFPNVIDPKHRLRETWAFKLGYDQPSTYPHADFAAVNVNIWITPDSANLSPASGGMNIYNVQAPASWDFDRYNKNGREIDAYLRKTSARAIEIPYRANRAVIFNSDLFHATQSVAFRHDYASRRINVTFLFGLREQDTGFQPTRGD